MPPQLPLAHLRLFPLVYSSRRLIRRAVVLPLLAAVVACGGTVDIPGAPGPTPSGAVPGFDTRDHPGNDVMDAWRQASPYRWVGYYLPAPCHTGTSWVGKRQTLERQGWGIAVLFVGEQDWDAMGAQPQTAAPADSTAPRCTRSNLTREVGIRDAAAADSVAAAEGFAAGTVIYLDVERVEDVSPALASYVEAWSAELLARGRYTPGLYAHARNARVLYAAVAEAFLRRGVAERPRLWVASQQGFDLGKRPSESGFPEAEVWQGSFDVTESWGGHALRIDANVARTAAPSR